MIVHTLLYRFPDFVTEEEQQDFFTQMRAVALGTGLVGSFDSKPHHWLPADDVARGMTAVAIVQFTCADLASLKAFSELPEVYDFITQWKAQLQFEAAYANHDPLAIDAFQAA
jgi:hypothetical protein